MLNTAQAQTGWSIVDKRLLPGDLVSVKTDGSWMSGATRWFEQRRGEDPSWASHSGIIDTVASGHETLVEALWKVTQRPLSAYAGHSRVVVMRHPVLEMSARFNIRDAAIRHLGQSYGWWKLFLHAAGLKSAIHSENRPICSQLAALAYQSAGVRFGLDADEAQPDDLLDFAAMNNWPVIWCDSVETLAELEEIYHAEDGVYANDLLKRYGYPPPDQ